jgi:serine protease Do
MKYRNFKIDKLIILIALLSAGTYSLIGSSRDGVSAQSSEKKEEKAAAAPFIPLPAGDPNIFVNLSKKVVPSVVNISTLQKTRMSRGATSQEELFRRFFEEYFQGNGGSGRSRPQPDLGTRTGPSRPLALGTGFIIDEEGLILTNNHVVAGADEIKISFTEDGEEKPTDGEVVGRDPELDLALIRVKTKRKLTPISLGDSDALQVGEYVMAVGNPFGQGHTVTHGIISAKGRKSPDFALANYIQTDTPINPGNSGGPLVNLKGEVIGINNAIDARAQGIGFAIPSNMVKSVLSQLKTKGKVSRGYIGVQIGELSPALGKKLGLKDDQSGVFIAHVQPGESADRAGIQAYDIITEFNGKKVNDGADLIQTVTAVPINESVKVKVLRGGKEIELKIRISARPSEVAMNEEVQRPKPTEKNSVRLKSGLVVGDLNPKLSKKLGFPENLKGALVSDVSPESPSERAGFEKNDLIVEVDRQKIESSSAFYGALTTEKSYLVRILRHDETGADVYAVLILDLRAES